MDLDGDSLVGRGNNGTYEVIDTIGQGSFGTVLKAKKLEVT